MQGIPFTKYHGAGNDFVLVDARERRDLDGAELAKKLCDRQLGVGADGLLLWLNSSIADHRMRIFNADGSEPTMCGNGAYCLLHYICSQTLAFLPLSLETAHAVLKSYEVLGNRVLNLGVPQVVHFPLNVAQFGPCYLVHTGVPHLVLFKEHLNTVDVEKEGRELRQHPAFAPEGANVNFVEVEKGGLLQVRTYERGVEAETLACGTGSAAAAFVAHKVYGLKTPIQVATRKSFASQEITYQPLLHMSFSPKEGEIEMRGHAHPLFTGVWYS